jgi:propionate catabolism operon transcriptional regulator
VRELRNLMERLALFLAAEPLQALTAALIQRVAPELVARSVDADTELPAVDGMETAPDLEDIHAALRRFRGNRAAAARHLGMSRTTLWRKLKQNTQA